MELDNLCTTMDGFQEISEVIGETREIIKEKQQQVREYQRQIREGWRQVREDRQALMDKYCQNRVLRAATSYKFDCIQDHLGADVP